MKNMKSLLAIAILTSSLAAMATDPVALPSAPLAKDASKKEMLKTDRLAVDDACHAEAAAAGCDNEKVGTGLLKCLRRYKKANKAEFKISDNCRTAMEKLKSDRSNR